MKMRPTLLSLSRPLEQTCAPTPICVRSQVCPGCLVPCKASSQTTLGKHTCLITRSRMHSQVCPARLAPCKACAKTKTASKHARSLDPACSHGMGGMPDCLDPLKASTQTTLSKHTCSLTHACTPQVRPDCLILCEAWTITKTTNKRTHAHSLHPACTSTGMP